MELHKDTRGRLRQELDSLVPPPSAPTTMNAITRFIAGPASTTTTRFQTGWL